MIYFTRLTTEVGSFPVPNVLISNARTPSSTAGFATKMVRVISSTAPKALLAAEVGSRAWQIAPVSFIAEAMVQVHGMDRHMS